VRNRLVHGEYFQPKEKNYLELVHKKVVSYFNDLIFREKLLTEDIVNPQRHFFGNKDETAFFIKAKDGGKLRLREILANLYKNGIHNPENYEYVYDDPNTQQY
jgi:hypothetical protein